MGGLCMKLCVLTVPLYGQPFREACEYLAASGVQALEIGAGGSLSLIHIRCV